MLLLLLFELNKNDPKYGQMALTLKANENNKGSDI